MDHQTIQKLSQGKVKEKNLFVSLFCRRVDEWKEASNFIISITSLITSTAAVEK